MYQYRLPLLFLFLIVGLTASYAQESNDDFSDYSYLWEDSKAKEKEAKRKPQKREIKLLSTFFADFKVKLGPKKIQKWNIEDF